MEVGSGVWVRDEEEGWVAGVIAEKSVVQDKCELVITVEEHERRITVADLAETDQVKRREQTKLVSDLISLPILHEPAILHALEQRYANGSIYTFNGAILIAVNPFQRLPLYTDEILESYYNSGLMKSQGIETAAMDPHVYTIADAAYRDMANCIAEGKPASQAVLISGESGAGKTETTKIVMRYLTVAGAGADEAVMEKILQSNPILEAFGNARTVRNDNSSRFGKFIDLKFDARGAMRGAAIETYLLEKIRLPRHAAGERNFHVFYQLDAAVTRDDNGIALAKADMKGDDWKLHGDCASHYVYTRQGGVKKISLDDGVEFVRLCTALKTLGFQADDARRAIALVAALLHLGDVDFEFDAGADGGGSTLVNDAELDAAALLAGLPRADLLTALTTRTVKTRTEEYVVRLVPDDAASARDAVAKALYGRLFDWLVDNINRGVRTAGDAADVVASIGVLDIFGFECFAVNSFEQLCINYTNETLQQQFNRYVFKLEQEEYAREAIKWSFIEFPDNQDCLDLIEGSRRQMPPDGGLLVMLDDECRLPRGSDANYAARVSKSLGPKTKRLAVSKKQMVDGIFEVNHYAGPVPYLVKGFLEKNKDELPRAADQLFDAARSTDDGALIGAICDSHHRAADRAAQALAAASAAAAKAAGRKTRSTSVKPTAGTITVGTQFKSQLASLMRAISATKPHYIRCLKPNDENVPNQFWKKRVTEQLRYGGVLEAVRVARSGFPVRMGHKDFVAHYAVLGPPPRAPPKGSFFSSAPDSATLFAQRCEALIEVAAESCKFEAQQAQLGKSKVFLRKSAHDALETARGAARKAAATVLTSVARSFLCSTSLAKRLKAARLVARAGRGSIGRARARAARRTKAATTLATCVRCVAAYRRFLAARLGAIALEALTRGVKGREKADSLRRVRAAIFLERTLGRGAPRRRVFRAVVSAFVALQVKARSRMARAALKRLRMNERDVGRLKKEQEAMKEEILRLRQQAAAASAEKEAAAAKAQAEEVERLKEAMERDRAQALEDQRAARQKATDEIVRIKESAEEQIARLRQALDVEAAARAKAEAALANAEEDRAAAAQERDTARQQSRDLEVQLAAANAAAEQSAKQAAQAQAAAAAAASLAKENPLPAPAAPPKQAQVAEAPPPPPPQPTVAPDATSAVVQEKESVIARLRAELEAERTARSEAEKETRELKATAEAQRRLERDALSRPEIAARRESLARKIDTTPAKQNAQFDADFDEDDGEDEADAEGDEVMVPRVVVDDRLKLVETFREKFAKSGAPVAVWEEEVAAGDPVSLVLAATNETDDDAPPALAFVSRSRNLFRRRRPPASVAFADILAVRPGHSSLCGLADEDDASFLTIVAEKQNDGDGGRSSMYRREVVVQFTSSDGKKEALAGLRHMVSESDLALSRRGAAVPEAVAATVAANDTPKSTPQPPNRKQAKTKVPVPAAAAAATPPAPLKEPPAAPNSEPPPPPPNDDAVAELEKQLLLERANNQKMMLQMLEMQNDVNRSSAKIVELKQEAASLRSQLVARDRMHADDARMRLQLGKRLQQLVFDNAALRRETVRRSCLALSDQSCAGRTQRPTRQEVLASRIGGCALLLFLLVLRLSRDTPRDPPAAASFVPLAASSPLFLGRAVVWTVASNLPRSSKKELEPREVVAPVGGASEEDDAGLLLGPNYSGFLRNV